MPPERRALDDLFSVTYEELRRLASSVKRGDQSVTLTPTALVNEAWLKLANSPRFASTSRLHFKRIAARAMQMPAAYPSDPMDRIIGATALIEGLPLVTADEQIQRSRAVKTIW